jgi:hypothetical protein
MGALVDRLVVIEHEQHFIEREQPRAAKLWEMTLAGHVKRESWSSVGREPPFYLRLTSIFLGIFGIPISKLNRVRMGSSKDEERWI